MDSITTTSAELSGLVTAAMAKALEMQEQKNQARLPRMYTFLEDIVEILGLSDALRNYCHRNGNSKVTG